MSGSNVHTSRHYPRKQFFLKVKTTETEQEAPWETDRIWDPECQCFPKDWHWEHPCRWTRCPMIKGSTPAGELVFPVQRGQMNTFSTNFLHFNVFSISIFGRISCYGNNSFLWNLTSVIRGISFIGFRYWYMVTFLWKINWGKRRKLLNLLTQTSACWNN